MASVDVSSGNSEQSAVFDKTSIPANLQPFLGGSEVLWRSFESLRNSTQSLGKALIETKAAMSQLKIVICSVLKTVHNSSEYGITDNFRHNLLLYVLSEVNQQQISSFYGGERASLTLSKTPNYAKYYNLIRGESLKLSGKSLLTKEPKVDETHETLEFIADDEEG